MTKKETTTRALEVTLTREEVEEKAQRMAQLERERSSLVEQKKYLVSELGAKQKAVDAEIASLGYCVREGKEIQQVECEAGTEKQGARWQWVTRRLDTGETVDLQPLTEAQRQEHLKLAEVTP